MPNDYISKLKQLSPELQAKLSEESFLSQLDDLDEQYGVKSVLILLGLLLREIDYSALADKLQADYGFNDFLAEEVKQKFGNLIKDLGDVATSPMPEPEIKISSIPPAVPTAIFSRPAAEPAAPITFSQADEEEVKKYINLSAAAPVDYNVAAQKLIAEFGYQSADEVLKKRLANIIVAKIKDIRDDLETKESLIKGQKIGGMAMTGADADRLLNLINNLPDQQANKWCLAKSPLDRSAESSADTYNPALPTPVVVLAGASDDEEMPEQKRSVDLSNWPTIELEDGLPVVRLPAASAIKPAFDSFAPDSHQVGEKKLPRPSDDVKINTAEREILPTPTPQPFIAEKRIPESVLNAKTASRPNLDDVKLEKKLMGPIEELANMTIIDFRRLAADPQTAVNKVKEKIDLLENESFNQKLGGISAWHKSEVSRFYRLLGQLSMSEQKNIEDVIRERLMSGKPTLSLDEFHAVMELNRALRY